MSLSKSKCWYSNHCLSITLANFITLAAGSHVVPDRQAEAHPHGAFAYKNFVYVADLVSML
jgi:hypothetical protein